jgi:hypothetical protein
VTARHADALADLLCEIALEPGSAAPGSDVRTLAWGGHSPEEMAAAWEPFRQAVLDREAAGSEDALQRASVRVDGAYRVLA